MATRVHLADASIEHSSEEDAPKKLRLGLVTLGGPASSTVLPAQYELLVREAIESAKHHTMIGINTITGEEQEFTFQEHLDMIGLTYEEWEAKMTQAITEFFEAGGKVSND